MRYLLSAAVMLFSISALLGGFFSGRAAVPQFAAATPAPQSTIDAQLLKAAPVDELAHDRFAADPAVVLAVSSADIGGDARLAFVIVDGGRSTALESPFLSLNVPVTLVINPSGGAASAMFALARQHGDAVYAQTAGPVTPEVLAQLRRRFPGLSGIAMRVTQTPSRPELRALRAAHLALFDEYGDSDAVAAQVRSAGVRYAARSITVDDHAQRSYVAYMLRQGVHLARRRTAVVMARPFPGTLQAFEDLLSRASREGVDIVELP